MRMLWKVIVLIVGVLLAGAAEPAVAGSATQNDGAPVEVSGGGMSPVVSGLQESTAQRLSSCRSAEFRGASGAISVQTSSNGTVAWGISMYDPALNPGPWVVDAFINNRRVDHKEQNCQPHGSVSPRDAKPTSTFSITATHTDLQGTTHHSVSNSCIVP